MKMMTETLVDSLESGYNVSTPRNGDTKGAVAYEVSV